MYPRLSVHLCFFPLFFSPLSLSSLSLRVCVFLSLLSLSLSVCLSVPSVYLYLFLSVCECLCFVVDFRPHMSLRGGPIVAQENLNVRPPKTSKYVISLILTCGEGGLSRQKKQALARNAGSLVMYPRNQRLVGNGAKNVIAESKNS